jgi:4-hydroxy-tetrahydrodipicolinate synthase
MFSGVLTALITPFKNGVVDEQAYTNFVDWQIKQGVHGLVPCGTTGESPTLSHSEHDHVVALCIEAAKNRVPVLAGTGSNSTAEAIRMTQNAKKAGADGALIVTPYYNKPTQRGLYAHFAAIHDAVEIPIIIYNIPGRSVVDMNVETMAELAKLPRIVGVKDATADLFRPAKALAAMGADFCQLSGEDATALEFNQAGGVGCISVTANIAPKLVSQTQNLWREGKVEEAFALQQKLIPLHDAMFCETSPAPVKYAASLLGLCQGDLRLPLVEITDESKAKVKNAMQQLGLI